MIVAFWVSFVITLALFGLAIHAGLRGRRRAHFVLAPAAIVALIVTILLTEHLARALVFPERQMSVHLVFAKTAAVLLVPVVVTGILTIRRPRIKRVHRVCVALFVLAVLIATSTGIWVFSLATPR